MKNQNENLWTTSRIVGELSKAIRSMSPKEKAKLRIELRIQFNLPAKPEPDAWEQ